MNDQEAPRRLLDDELRLAPVAVSVGQARRFLRELLTRAARPDWVDAAELAVSEIVTNAVLHAHTDLVVRVSVLEDLVRVEVHDGNPALPTQRRSADAERTTGRGLELVVALTRECGIRAEGSGKVVWFTVGDEDEHERSEADLLAAWDVDGEVEVDGPAPESRDVVLRDMPITLWLAAREHHQALLRELVLYLAEHGDSMPSRPDMVAADEARSLIWSAVVDAVDHARATGTARRPLPTGHPSPLPDVPESVDLVLQVPLDLAAGFAAFQDALDTGEQLAVSNRLLVRPGLPEIIAVRDWACDQVVAQLQGVPPGPWPGADQSHFLDEVNERAGEQLPGWDDTVTGSDRSVVAADDANRIIAISDPLARTLGWSREEVVGRRVVALIPPHLREAHVAGFSRHLTTGQAHVLGVPLELPVLHRDGSEIPCRFLIERTDAARGRPVYVAWIDPVGS
jgi:PAS domain S-box-containing protein